MERYNGYDGETNVTMERRYFGWNLEETLVEEDYVTGVVDGSGCLSGVYVYYRRPPVHLSYGTFSTLRQRFI